LIKLPETQKFPINNATSPPAALEHAVDISHFVNDIGWNTFRITPQDSTPERSIFYIHGGAFVMHMLDRHWQAISEISVKSNAEITIPAYPLAPEATAKSTPYEMANILEGFLQNTGAGHAFLVGDSAGGNLALSALTLLRDQKASLPARTILISPWLNLELADSTVKDIDAPGMDVSLLRQDAHKWRGDLEFSDPLVNPLNGALHELGKIAVFCGTNDVVYPGCQQLAEAASAQPGTELEFHETLGAGHSYVLNDTSVGRAGRSMICDMVAGK